MCRIFGYWGGGGEYLDLMERPLYPGGPDHYGRYWDEWISIGHRRLAIIDLSEASNQPFSFEHLVMSYNGEIYNFRQIRDELREYEFLTDSDTEVVIKAFHKWGLAALDRFIGMFAIALWDRRSKKLHLIRDRFGVKPLYYYHDQERFIFASELKGILAHPDFHKRIDAKSAALFFQLGYIPTPFSIYERTYKLEPATILTFDGRKITKRRYYELESVLKKPRIEPDVDRLEELLEEAFSLRLIADVEVGIFLSGGVDSSLVAALLSKKAELKAYTIGFEEQKFDESEYAKEVAKELGLEWRVKSFGVHDLFKTMDDFVEVFDEPFGDSSALPTMLLSRFVASDLKVALSADGADELFWGYPINFKWAKRREALKKIAFLSPLLRRLPIKELKKRGYLCSDDLLEFKLAMRYRYYPDETVEAYELEEMRGEELLERLFWFDFRYFLIDDVLVKVDRASMAASLEAREPFLDHRIVEYALRLPPSAKEHKKILKELLERYLPTHLIWRPKQGFNVPIKRWLFNELYDDVRRKIAKSDTLHSLIKKVPITPKRYNELWYAYIFARWEERWG
jgi:asparagine synthase (glutamine-hydrolysing)